MSWLGSINGKTNGRAAVQPAAMAQETASPITAGTVPATNYGSSTEVSRFMPVMDIEQAVARRNVIVQAMKQLMVDGVDYGKIPGCGDKPALLLPGAQKLCNLFGLTIKYDFLEKTEDWSGEQHGGEPFFYYQIRAEVYRGEFLIAEGVGACHSWEAKYRWRKMERICPNCGKANIRKSKEGGWYCWKKTEGCGSVFNDGDPAIEGQETGRKPNPDVCDSVNTILKMAYKRTLIHGTINGTSCSEFFTQDVEDFTVTDDPIDIGGHPMNTRAAAQHVAEQKISGNAPLNRPFPWKSMRETAEAFKAIREKVGEVLWLGELERYGWHSFQEMRNALDAKGPNIREKVAACYWGLDAITKGGR